MSTTKTKHQVQSTLLLDVVIAEGTAVLKLLSSKDQTLLIGGDSLLVLNFGLDIVDGVGGLHVKGDSLTSQGLDKDLHTSTETKDQVQGGLLLDVVVTEGTSVLELLTGKDQTLLIGGDSLLVLNFGLDIVDGVGGLDVEGDGLSGEGFDEDLR